MYDKETSIREITSEPFFTDLRAAVSAPMYNCIVAAIGYAYSRGAQESISNHFENIHRNESLSHNVRAVTH